MFFNLAWRNSKRSRNENLIYFLTMVTAVAAFYIVLSLGAQDVIRFLSSLESDAVERLLTNLLPTVYVCALLFVFFLVVFANKYQLECRSRELGLYLMFGMTKTRLFTQIMTEGLITSLVALLGGLICGGFLSEVISLATARLVGHGVIAHQSSFSLSAVFFTILGFLIIQCVALFILCGKLFKKEVHQLLYGEMGKKQHTGSTHGSLLSLVIGTAVLLVAYWVVIEHFMTGGGVMLLVAVLLGIVGTILFIRGIMLLIIACALLALQFLTQMQSTKSRYLTLSILGARREQIKRSIYKQVLWYFLLPLMLACISGTVGLYAMQQHLYSDSTRIGQSYPLLIIMAFTVVLIMAIYGVAVARTATREIGKINYKPNS